MNSHGVLTSTVPEPSSTNIDADQIIINFFERMASSTAINAGISLSYDRRPC